MARGKKGKPAGKSRGGAQHGGRSFGSSSRPVGQIHHGDQDAAPFSLRDAARAEHHSSSWTPTVNLRHCAIGFVRSDDPSPVNASTPTSPEPEIIVEAQLKNLNGEFADSTPQPRIEVAVLPRSRTVSRSSSNGSEEVVLFRGRNLTEPLDAPIPSPASLPVPRYPLRSKHKNSRSITISPEDYISIQAEPNTDHRTRKLRGKRQNVEDDADMQEILDDYVTNMQEHGVGKRETDGSAINNEHERRDGWSSSDLQDFDDLSTSDEVLDAVKSILSKRYRPTGVQYLVVWEGSSVDEARWISQTSLTMDGAAELLADFEESEKQVPEYPDGSDDEDEDTEEEEDEDRKTDEPDEEDYEDVSTDDDSDSAQEDLEDDQDLIERRIARMTDEQLARLFAKQEELGLDSADLILYDGMFAHDAMYGADSDVELQDALALSRRRSQKRRKPSRRQTNSFGAFDELMALDGDGPDDFDVMDRERPSISRGYKAKTDPMLWDLSDSDQAKLMSDTWAADRMKKRVKKQEREDLRAQGLLGKKNKFKPDLNAKYRDGLDIDQLGNELRAFLLSTAESRALPPMDKRDRKVMHEVAVTFGLKSFSRGSGRTRFTTLQRTSKTIEFDDEVFRHLRSKVSRRFYPRMDRNASAGKSVSRRKGGGSGTVRADFGYREGEVVGGTAPELGAENRGRAMLEKMGWTTGNALGLNNKGILQPIAHVIRNSRAGLG